MVSEMAEIIMNVIKITLAASVLLLAGHTLSNANPGTDNGGSFTDARDSQVYRTVKIGNLTWMAENLNFQTNKDSSWCYNNVDSNCVKYGRLYTWNTAMTACPAGWKLPDTSDWRDLVTVAGCVYGDCRSGDESRMLRSKTGWVDDYGKPNDYGTDDFGFSALPSGHYYSNVGFKHIGCYTSWWSATDHHLLANWAYFWDIHWEDGMVQSALTKTLHARSVRCVRQ
jgi:uncharacterized protein (TIGR02145 family)